MTYLYHAHLPEEFGNYRTGYIGITDNPEERFQRHRAGYSGSPILKRALEKYRDVEFTIISEGSREEILRMEAWLRPTKLGWNATPGGGAPPNQLGKIMTQEQKDKIGLSNSGVNGPGWKGWWVIEGVKYESAKIAAASIGCSKFKVQHRAKNPKYPEWYFEPQQQQ